MRAFCSFGKSAPSRFGHWYASEFAEASTLRVPILKQGDYVIASIQSALTDDDLLQLRDGLADVVGKYRSKGVIVDVTALDVMDSFATRSVRDLAQVARLRGAQTVIVGIQPEVAFAMVQLGLELGKVATALDLEEALALLRGKEEREAGR
jgi:rsbT antagonist protein RsbS